MKNLWQRLTQGRIAASVQPLPTPEGQVELTLAMVYGQTHKKVLNGAPGRTPEQVAREFVMDSGRAGIFDMGGNRYLLLRDVRDITVKKI